MWWALLFIKALSNPLQFTNSQYKYKQCIPWTEKRGRVGYIYSYNSLPIIGGPNCHLPSRDVWEQDFQCKHSPFLWNGISLVFIILLFPLDGIPFTIVRIILCFVENNFVSRFRLLCVVAFRSWSFLDFYCLSNFKAIHLKSKRLRVRVSKHNYPYA